jgi:hypothetical protein
MQKVGKFVYWFPRIASILFIMFLALFSLDVFGNNYTFLETILALLMHNIPVFILIIILWVSWKYEIVGSVAFILAGLLYIGQMIWNALSYNFEFYMISYSFIIAGPAFVIGILFLINWIRKKGRNKNNKKEVKNEK